MATDVYQQANSAGDDLFDGDDLADLASTPQDTSFAVETEGNDELNALLNEGGGEGVLNWEELNSRDLDQTGKADNAVDYEDISDDDDLPDEEDTIGGTVQADNDQLPTMGDTTMADLTFDGSDDDLFGAVSSPVAAPEEETTSTAPTRPQSVRATNGDNDSDLASEHNEDQSPKPQVKQAPENMDDEDMIQWRLQLALFENSGKVTIPQTEQENIEEWLKLEFPMFRKDQNPFFNALFPPRPMRWNGKTPFKPPKPIRPTKINLDVEQDQRILFNSATTAVNTNADEDQNGLIWTKLRIPNQEVEESSDESDLDEPLPGGITMQELEYLCTDFDTLSAVAGSDIDMAEPTIRPLDTDDEMFGLDEFNDLEQPRKKRRLGPNPQDVVSIHLRELPSFDDPERATAKLSGKVILDLNDPALLVEEIDPESVRAKTRPGEKNKGLKTLKTKLDERFKISNDTEYDLLKQNHQHKVRGQLGHLTIDHSLPAIRLQYPYYQVKLDVQELRNYHRKRMQFKHAIVFNKPNKQKRKAFKGKATKDIFAASKDLSIADNSTAVLLEYSEEHPLMLSQIGMGNRIVNYYRRKAQDDASRPKHELGETTVLLPEDKSPFHIFGHIDPGEDMTALYNSMYRAPIFEQDAKPQEFLVVRETTGMQGQHHYLRNIDHMFVVGQELPSTTIPGTHSRMVTTAAKNRLKAISFRIARRKKNHRIRVEDVTRHFPDTTDMQNRQKMKEFMTFSKEHKEWEMRAGEIVPDEDAVQGLIRPEDVCLLESMQVGAQYLQDAGYGDDDDDEDKDKENDNDSIEQQLAPWRTTKNFIQATQGKAMLRLFGEGDPSGRGEAFSFIKTSMKGGFKAIGGSAQDAITLKKELGGHSYNVARQQKSYEQSIRGIWDKQKASLGSKIEPSDLDMEGDVDTREETRERAGIRATPMSTPGPGRRRDDDTGTSFSKRSVNSQTQKWLKITRNVLEGGRMVRKEHLETDPAVIRAYTRIKEAQEMATINLADVAPTGDSEFDARQRKRIEEELARLQKARARREQRDKVKAAVNATSPGGAMSPDGEPATPVGRQVQATQRKCANCGQVGHIKTNKKLCPLLNGSARQEDGYNNIAFMGAPPALS